MGDAALVGGLTLSTYTVGTVTYTICRQGVVQREDVTSDDRRCLYCLETFLAQLKQVAHSL